MAKKRTTSIAFLATIFVLAAVTFVAIFMNASADLALPTQPSNLPSTFASGGTAIGRIWDIIVAAAAIIFMVLLLIGGLQYLTSGGDEGVATKAKNLLRDALVGIIIVVLAWPIGVAILTEFGLHSGDLIRINDTRFRVPNAGPATDTTSEGVGLGTENQTSSTNSDSSNQNAENQNRARQVTISTSVDNAGKQIIAKPISEGLTSRFGIVSPTGQVQIDLVPDTYQILMDGIDYGLRTVETTSPDTINWRIDAKSAFHVSINVGAENATKQIRILKASSNGPLELIIVGTTDASGIYNNLNLKFETGETYVILDENDQELGQFIGPSSAITQPLPISI